MSAYFRMLLGLAVVLHKCLQGEILPSICFCKVNLAFKQKAVRAKLWRGQRQIPQILHCGICVWRVGNNAQIQRAAYSTLRNMW